MVKHALIAGLIIACSTSAISAASDSFPAEKIEAAPIALLVDAQTGQVLYAKEADRRFMPASITKIMTAFVAFELIDNGELSVERKFAMSPSAADIWYRQGSTLFLEPGEQRRCRYAS